MKNKTSTPDAAPAEVRAEEQPKPQPKSEEATPQKPGRVPGARPVEAWAKELRVGKLDLAMARCVRRWPVGLMVTRQQFTEAIEAGKNVPIR